MPAANQLVTLLEVCSRYHPLYEQLEHFRSSPNWYMGGGGRGLQNMATSDLRVGSTALGVLCLAGLVCLVLVCCVSFEWVWCKTLRSHSWSQQDCMPRSEGHLIREQAHRCLREHTDEWSLPFFRFKPSIPCRRCFGGAGHHYKSNILKLS